MRQTLLSKLINKATAYGKLLRTAVLILAAVVAVCAFIYFIYWIAKSGSYILFYEDMVQDTIREMVKAGSLK